MRQFCEIARYQPVLVITDLDRVACAATLIRGWTANDTLPVTLLLRVAVREVEAWLLADHDAMRTLLQRPRQILPPIRRPCLNRRIHSFNWSDTMAPRHCAKPSCRSRE